jgi:branched-chain amino acid aminotransferase
VVEGSADNIFIVKNGVLITPPAFLGILKGITREVVMELAQAMGTEVRETVFTRHDLYNADECFFTGTGAELIPVVEVDGRSIGTGKPGEMTKQLLAAFRKERTETGVPIYPCCQYPSAS